MTNVVRPLQHHARNHPDSLVIRGDDRHWSYAELLADSLDFAVTLRRAGHAPGARIVLIAPTVPEFVIAYLGMQAAGVVTVPMNTMSTREEIEYVLGDAGATAIIAWHADNAAAIAAGQASGVEVISLEASGPHENRIRETTEVVEREPTDTAAILYTSGTTGRPKGAELTVTNILEAAKISVEIGHTTAADRFATGLPLFHVFGQISVMMAAITAGASMTLVSPFDPTQMVQALRRHRITVLSGVPTMWNALLRAAADAEPGDFTSVRVAVSGGASLPAEVSKAFEERFGCPVLEGYGLTETASLGTFADINRDVKIGFAGIAAPHTSIELRGSDGRVVPRGDVGEVWISGPSVMKGYWGRPQATDEVLINGWFRTGDLALQDDEGDYRIVGRLKDLIIRGGYNVYPGEVEEVLYEHPDIIEAAVIGVPDDYYGEEVAAVISVVDNSSLTGPQVTAWARERMSPYKIPRIVRIVEHLPKGPSGKIHKRSLRIE